MNQHSCCFITPQTPPTRTLKILLCWLLERLVFNYLSFRDFLSLSLTSNFGACTIDELLSLQYMEVPFTFFLCFGTNVFFFFFKYEACFVYAWRYDHLYITFLPYKVTEAPLRFEVFSSVIGYAHDGCCVLISRDFFHVSLKANCNKILTSQKSLSGSVLNFIFEIRVYASQQASKEMAFLISQLEKKKNCAAITTRQKWHKTTMWRTRVAPWHDLRDWKTPAACWKSRGHDLWSVSYLLTTRQSVGTERKTKHNNIFDPNENVTETLFILFRSETEIFLIGFRFKGKVSNPNQPTSGNVRIGAYLRQA